MSMNVTHGNGPAVKSRTEIKKDADQLYRRSFGDLPDGTIYRDPAGWKSGDGEAIEIQKERFEQLARYPVPELDHMVPAEKRADADTDHNHATILKAWNEYQRSGFGVTETTQEIRKNLDTGDWTLPLDIIPQVFVVNPERLPMADMMTRVTTQDDEVVPTPLTDHPDMSWGLETTDDTEGSYDYKDPSYDDTVSFTVVGYGAATRLEDKLILASSNLRNAESTQEQAFMRGLRQSEERAIILGSDYNANAWTGFNDLIANQDGGVVGDLDPDAASDSDFENATAEVIDQAEFAGAPRESLAVVCDFDWHKKVRDSLRSRQRYEGSITEVGAGFSTFTVDDVPVFKSHAIPKIGSRADGATYNQVYTVNMEATYLSMLQEPQVKPLAKVGPQEQMAVDAYGTLTSEDNGAHIQAYTVSPTA